MLTTWGIFKAFYCEPQSEYSLTGRRIQFSEKGQVMRATIEQVVAHRNIINIEIVDVHHLRTEGNRLCWNAYETRSVILLDILKSSYEEPDNGSIIIYSSSPGVLQILPSSAKDYDAVTMSILFEDGRRQIAEASYWSLN